MFLLNEWTLFPFGGFLAGMRYLSAGSEPLCEEELHGLPDGTLVLPRKLPPRLLPADVAWTVIRFP